MHFITSAADAAARQALSQVRNIRQWNKVREAYKDILTQSELCLIDNDGLITEVLGFDREYHEFWKRIEAQQAR